jgi:hypothetical protein
MPFQPVPDTVQAKFEGRIDGQQTINDLYFHSTIGPRSAAEVFILTLNLNTWYAGLIAPQLNEAWTGVRTAVKGLSNAAAITAELTMGDAVGGIAGEFAPNNVSMAVKFSTGLSGRSSHGRNYVPALTNSQIVGNTIVSGWATAVVEAYGALLAGGEVLPAGWDWVVVSRRTGGEARPTGVTLPVMAVSVTDLTVDSMRSRLPGRGL